jgi:hypothetical protein
MFRLHLSPDARAALDAKYRAIDRLYSLTDRWLAEELLRLSRQIRQDNPQVQPSAQVCEASFLWHLVPEIARRLGATRFLTNERTDDVAVMYSASELREHTGYALRNMSQNALGRSPAVTLLLNEPCNGNPAAFALDRIAPPCSDAVDPIAIGINEVAKRRGVLATGMWSPSMNTYSRQAVSEL